MKVLFVILLFQFPFQLAAASWDRKSLEKSALDYLIESTATSEDSKLSFNISPIDPRIKIKPCALPLDFKIIDNNTNKRKNIEVSCADDNHWKMYLSATIEATFGVVVPVNTLAKGTLITTDDVKLIYLAENKVRGIKFQDTNQIIGSKSKKRLSKGKPINQSDICMICKGDPVMIIAKTGGLEIKTQGIAKSSGNKYQQISVENKSSGKLITAQVKSLNKVIINL